MENITDAMAKSGIKIDIKSVDKLLSIYFCILFIFSSFALYRIRLESHKYKQ